MLVRSLKGKLVDITALIKENENAIAVTGSGVRMNARGDLLGPGGTIIKTKEELDKEYAIKLENSVKNARNVGLGSNEMNRFQTKEEKITPAKATPIVQNVNEYIDVNDPQFDEKLKKQVIGSSQNVNSSPEETKKYQQTKKQTQQKSKNTAPDEIVDDEDQI